MNELRASGRTLTGVAVRYGDAARVFDPTRGQMVTERIERGAFQPLGAVVLELEHRRDRPVAMLPGALTLTDTDAALEIRAELPETSDADAILAGVQSGMLRGLSVDMRVDADRLDGDTRVIERATLNRVAVVRRGAYPRSKPELRNAIGTIRGAIPSGVRLACECHRSADTDEIEIVGDALWRSIEQAEDEDREILAYYGKRAIASRKRGTLGFRLGRNDTVEVDVDIPDTETGDDIRETSEAVDLLVRPLFDPERSEYTETGGVGRYSFMWVRAFIVGPTIADGGWDAATFAPRGGA